MVKKIKSFFLKLLSLLTLSTPLLAQDCQSECADCNCQKIIPQSYRYPHKFYIGPEFYYVQRKRAAGTKQCGDIYGVRGGYDRIKRLSIYWGFEFLYGSGNLHGKSGLGRKIKSHFTDEEIEGRLGYTFQSKKSCRATLTPYLGYGYFRETNKFCHPTPVRLKFQNCFNYVTAGFLSSIYLYPQLTVGINFRANIMMHAKCRVSHDPDFDNSTQYIKDKVNYRVELPFCYSFAKTCNHLEIDLVPFYEHRHYGGRENYPFDFHDTKLRIYGVSLFLGYRI